MAYTIDPVTKLPVSQPPTGMVPVPDNSNLPDPYTQFYNNVSGMMKGWQDTVNTANANIQGTIDTGTNQAMGAAGANDPTIDSRVSTANQKGLLGAFQPRLTSLEGQGNVINSALQNMNNAADVQLRAAQPEVLSPGQSLVTKGGETLAGGGQWIANPMTGGMEFFPTTPTETSGGTTPTTGGGVSNPTPSNDPFESIFGKSNSIGAYATDPDYIQKISSVYSRTSFDIKSLGYDQNPVGALNQYIKNQPGNAPVTGAMVVDAANAYGIDPLLLASVLHLESDFGTDGVGAKTMNPGNQGNTGSATRTFNSWREGVNATASNLANRIKAANTGTSGGESAPTVPTESKVGGVYSGEALAKIQKLPATMQGFVDSGPAGVAYINADRVPANITAGLQNLSSKAGIPFVQPGDVVALKSIQSVFQSLDAMQNLAEENLASGTIGTGMQNTLGRLNQVAQTEWGRNLATFNNYRDTAIKSVQALAGGAGSGLRINGAEIDANTSNLPTATDNLEMATKKIQTLKQILYTQLATTFPDAEVPVKSKDGTQGTVPAKSLVEAVKLGVTIQ